ncbi:Ribosomal RNA small subunit methyltransferase A [Rickettsiales endosymbiont of Paramecium tredecaurelia]|uniref:16S rRNA (adenine(1518)-N(6)/adenine(1519)-N(6))- dimethyltransferase RsmA n=1 Tax=Candidatus Sarmatiella mevalonica TaxID=2770581 RepID=UPI001921626F|nr:16S rRNA (adenine(1518)-N(6)/adenine(1519)-N(6))-dimethyltransferase RsmA [Candidatus Sarmatiella mevalonica]MBL3284527.1 Ribosomal RNA small subunit methyltransferase A [Candidatus Sarmatiella mevalonica]
MQITIKELADAHNIRALKQYGQNFLFDSSLCVKIAKAAALPANARVVEVGPGVAGLTIALLQGGVGHLIVIEKDKRFLPLLQQVQSYYPNLEIIMRDAQDCKMEDLSGDDRQVHIVSNLPYNIGTKLLIGWAKEIDYIATMTLMFQKEVGQRIVAEAHSKEYGRLSVIAQLLFDVKKLFDIKSTAFTPAPKVDSVLLRFVPKKDYAEILNLIPFIEFVTHKAFAQRRKMLGAWIKRIIPRELMDEFASQIGLDMTLRAENLTPATYMQIARFLQWHDCSCAV